MLLGAFLFVLGRQYGKPQDSRQDSRQGSWQGSWQSYVKKTTSEFYFFSEVKMGGLEYFGSAAKVSLGVQFPNKNYF